PGHPAPTAPAFAPGAAPAMGPPAAPAHAMPAYAMPVLHKPGIIALRPLGLGDVMDGSIKAIRRNPGATLGLSAVVILACLIPSAILSTLMTMVSMPSPEDPSTVGNLGTLPASLLEGFFTALATGLLSGLLVHVIGEAVLGRRTTMGRTWSSTRRRLLPVLGAHLLVDLAILVPALVVAGAGLLVALNVNGGAGILVGFLGALPCVAGAIWLSTRTALAAPTIVLEGTGVRSALRRSFALTRGVFWRTFGIILLVSVIGAIAGSMLTVPFTLVGFVGMAATGDNLQSGLVMMVIASHLGRIASGTLTTPFIAGVIGLLYIDRRIRLEGLDVTLMRAAAADAAGRRG
ncbi:MAG TPA: glycerophosphoryl diester phosphodiesterase membrane domain-containing protein, partial [Oryzihumus sp.]|nr:glycerophosphoryl diester phosphodiesterase membrane domain-containing protein [Oryzihumus sp.]